MCSPVGCVSCVATAACLSEGEKCPSLRGNGVVKQESREVQEDVIDLSTQEQGEAGTGWEGWRGDWGRLVWEGMNWEGGVDAWKGGTGRD